MMRIFFRILFLLLASISAIAQKKDALANFGKLQSPDSVKIWTDSLAQSKPDAIRVQLLHKLSYPILFSRPDSALKIAQQGLSLANSLNYRKGKILCECDIGAVSWILGDYAKAHTIFNRCYDAALQLKDPHSIDWTLSFLVSVNRDLGSLKEALRLSEMGLNQHLAFKDSFWRTVMGSVYIEMKEPDLALQYLLKGDTGSYNMLLLGDAYSLKNQNESAKLSYRSSISGLKYIDNYKDLTDAFLGLANVFKSEGNIDSAIYFADKGLAIAEGASFKKWVLEISTLLANIYADRDPKKAVQYFKIANEARDSMNNVQRITESLSSDYAARLSSMQSAAANASYLNKMRTLTLLSGLVILLITAILLYRNNRQKQAAKLKIQNAYDELRDTQAQLVQREKMASLGELTAGIAHEIQNPLNFVNNFSEVNKELISEMKTEIENKNYIAITELANDLEQNLDKINHHGHRADSIVKSMLQHSRKSAAEKEIVDINAMCDEYIRLAYHGFRAREKEFNVDITTNYESSQPEIRVVPQDFGRVLLNLLNNSFYAVWEKSQKAGSTYKPFVSIQTSKKGKLIELCIEDNGVGIPVELREKIFQPFFTTKPTGQGTGLGLSLSYDIIKSFGGSIILDTETNDATRFIINLPVNLDTK